MHRIIFIIFPIFLVGCGSNYYTATDFGSKENYYNYLSNLKGDEVEIVFLNDEVQRFKILEYYPDSLIVGHIEYDAKFQPTIYGKKTILMNNIHLIRIISSQFVEGLLIGAGSAGFIMGVMSPIATGSSNGGNHYDFEPNMGIGASIGGFIGMIVGSFYEKEIVFFINPMQAQ